MKKLQCELCQSVDIVKTAQGLFECQHCGCKYTAEQARGLISGTVEIVLGNAELERQLNNAEAQRKLGEYFAAMDTYQKLQREFPADYRCRWGWLETAFAHHHAMKEVPSPAGARQMQSMLKKVFSLEKDEVLVYSFKRGWMAFWESVAKSLINGEYTIQDWERMEALSTAIPCYKALSPGMADAMQCGMDTAEEMSREHLVHSHFGKAEWYITQHNNVLFALGKHIAVEWTYDDLRQKSNLFTTKSVTPFEGERRTEILNEAQARANASAAKGYCDYCGSSSVKKRLFDVRCSKCGRKW